jgi:hypothetical protein
MVRQLLGGIGDGYRRLGVIYRGCSERVEKAASVLDFDMDFGEFVITRKVARYDLRDLEFVTYQGKPEAFSAISAKLGPRLEIAPVYPMGMARVIADHYASGPNQLSCTRGKSLLLMEPTDDEWCYVMNPITLGSGFVPKCCLEPIGKALGVVIREVPGLEQLFVGDCVAIMDSSSTTFEVETVFGANVSVTKAVIGVIFSENDHRWTK